MKHEQQGGRLRGGQVPPGQETTGDDMTSEDMLIAPGPDAGESDRLAAAWGWATPADNSGFDVDAEPISPDQAAPLSPHLRRELESPPPPVSPEVPPRLSDEAAAQGPELQIPGSPPGVVRRQLSRAVLRGLPVVRLPMDQPSVWVTSTLLPMTVALAGVGAAVWLLSERQNPAFAGMAVMSGVALAALAWVWGRR